MDEKRYELFKKMNEFLVEDWLKRCGAYACGYVPKVSYIGDDAPQKDQET